MNLPTLALILGLASSQAFDYGALEIRAQPGLEVVWEGVHIGALPATGRLRIREIPPGKYRLELKRGNEALLDQWISIAPGRQDLSLQASVLSAPGKASSAEAIREPDLPVHPPVVRTPPEPDSQVSAAPSGHSPRESEEPAALAGIGPDERSSRRVVASEGAPWVVLLLLVVGTGTLAFRQWRRRREAGRPAGAPFQYVPMETRIPLRSRLMPDEEASFLEALEDGETALESDVEIIPPARPRSAIDIDSRPVSGDDEESEATLR